MTFKRFKKDLLDFVGNSTVNLGRKNTRTRTQFLDEIKSKLTAFENDQIDITAGKKTIVKEEKHDTGRLICMKPKDKRRALDGGKGITTMTASESARADEELGRSPFKTEKKE